MSAARADGASGRRLNRASDSVLNAVRLSSPSVFGPRSVDADANVDTVRSVRALPDPVPVWNLTVEDQPEFFANGILTHNCTWTPESGESPDRLDALVWALTELLVNEKRGWGSA